mgnify:CR=1 FL=1
MKYKSYPAYREAWKNAGTNTPTIPLNIDIELSATCNLQCPFCFVTNPKFKKEKEKIKNKFMPIKLVSDIILAAAEIGVPSLKFNWRGEPTLHPNFTDILKIARTYYKKPFYDLIVNTNGNYNTEKCFVGLMQCTKVIFSVDSLQPAIYKKMRVNGDLTKLKNNISDLLAAGHDGIVLQRVITKENEKENFKHDVESNFGNYVKISEHYAFNRNSVYKKFTGQVNQKPKRIYCGYPSQRLVIDVDGYYHPCCVDLYGEISLGNFKLNTIMETWDSIKLSNLRNTLKNKKHIEIPTCQSCQSYMSFDCPEREKIIG